MELGSKSLSVDKPFRHEHVFADEDKVGNHDRDRSKQHLQLDMYERRCISRRTSPRAGNATFDKVTS